MNLNSTCIVLIVNLMFSYISKTIQSMNSIVVMAQWWRMSISWSNIKNMSVDCNGDQFLQQMENMRYTVTKKAFRNWNICGYIYPNGIENVPEMLSCFGSLEISHVSENFIGELDRTVFQRFTKLKHLHLDYTQVVNFDFSVIQSKQLQIFHISSNSLKRMNNASILKTFTKLEEFRAASKELEKNFPSYIS